MFYTNNSLLKSVCKLSLFTYINCVGENLGLLLQNSSLIIFSPVRVESRKRGGCFEREVRSVQIF